MEIEKKDQATVTNIQRLRAHLEAGSLAVMLVEGYESSAPEQRRGELKAIAERRLDEIRDALAGGKAVNASD